MKKTLVGILSGLLFLLPATGCGPQEAGTSSAASSRFSTVAATSTSGLSTTSPQATDTTATDTPQTTAKGENTTTGRETGSSTTRATTAAYAAVTKVVSADAGKDYFLVAPSQNHPGVVGMDAVYTMQARDKAQNYLAVGDMEVSTNNPAVQVKGTTLTVPYAVRASADPLVVMVKQKSHPNRTGTYTFHFQKFSAQPTLNEDFNTESTLFRDGTYETGRDYGNALPGVVENGNLVYYIEKGGDGFFRTTCDVFKQAYGCFSARIQMPTKALVNGAFWLCTAVGDTYIKNPQRPSQSGGELDVVEYFPTWGDQKWAATIHWNGWSGYHTNAGKEPQTGTAIRGNYHVYSAVWTPEAIYWYFDGILSWTYTGEGVQPNSGAMHVMLQASNPGKDSPWGGKYDPTAFPDVMKTDWVKVYALA